MNPLNWLRKRKREKEAQRFYQEEVRPLESAMAVAQHLPGVGDRLRQEYIEKRQRLDEIRFPWLKVSRGDKIERK